MKLHPVLAGFDLCCRTMHLSNDETHLQVAFTNLLKHRVDPKHKKFVLYLGARLKPYFENEHLNPPDFLQDILKNKRNLSSNHIIQKIHKQFQADLIHQVAAIHSREYHKNNAIDHAQLYNLQEKHDVMMQHMPPHNSKTIKDLFNNAEYASKHLRKNFSAMEKDVIVTGIKIGFLTYKQRNDVYVSDKVEYLQRQFDVPKIHQSVTSNIAYYTHSALDRGLCLPGELYLQTISQKKDSLGYNFIKKSLYDHDKDLLKLEKKAVNRKKNPQRIQELQQEIYANKPATLLNKLAYLSVDDKFYDIIDLTKTLDGHIFLENVLELIQPDEDKDHSPFIKINSLPTKPAP